MKKQAQGNSEHINTIVGTGTKFKGDIDVDGGLRVDGSFEGNIKSKGKLSIGKDGSIKATSIEASAAIIGGSVEAELTAPQLVKLESTAKFKGSIVTQVLIIEQGAVFNGSSDMQGKKS